MLLHICLMYDSVKYILLKADKFPVSLSIPVPGEEGILETTHATHNETV